ncbi:MAG: alpha/beta hydrolase [Gammaproteobacteria bacterium]|nr:alpha/beta hydrolase [Gammaproteobacteria bacterium]
MNSFQINDWDNAYANGVNIANGDRWPEAWAQPAKDYRSTNCCELDIAYGSHQRQLYDLFLPQHKPRGLFVYIHGGYWKALDKSYWSHLARGAVDAGWAVAMPSYVLCPEASIAEIATMVASCIEHAAARIAGPLVISGHSAGGQLASLLACQGSALGQQVAGRIAHVVSISGVHDLRPLLRTTLNNELKLDEASATALSPALKQPLENLRLTTWVGGAERAEFRRQSALLANIWRGLGARTLAEEHPDRHHFNIIDDLADVNSPLMKTALDY